MQPYKQTYKEAESDAQEYSCCEVDFMSLSVFDQDRR